MRLRVEEAEKEIERLQTKLKQAGDDALVQRQLTKRFFLHNNDKLLITFSAGVAELGTPEGIKRADAAMYLA